MDILQIPSITEQAEFLKARAHCIGIKTSDIDVDIYYIYDHFGYDRDSNDYKVRSYGYIVHYVRKNKRCLPVHITKSKPEDIQLIVDSMGLYFGE